jgi:alcohol dehydrogenase
MQKAACYAGLAIAETRTALAHAISYPITAKFGVPHGLACSFTLASILDLLDGSNVDIPTSSIVKVKKLLKTLNLERRLESYVSWDTLIQADFSDLETSRSGNFIYDVDSYLIKSILNDARKRALRN